MKIYTRQGDHGDTALYGGRRVSKSSPRIDVYGTVDELNSVLGITLTCQPSPLGSEILASLQHQLFILGGDLATPADSKQGIDRIGATHTATLEGWIDRIEDILPPLTRFILPGGSACASHLHLARTVCRRAERSAILCMREDPLNESAIVYLNRLSDLLFMLARHENQHAGVEDTPWIP
jgi:cob(I)alamin adenosyltransferase